MATITDQVNLLYGQLFEGNLGEIGKYIVQNAIANRQSIFEDISILIKLNVPIQVRVFLLKSYINYLHRQKQIRSEAFSVLDTVFTEALNHELPKIQPKLGEFEKGPSADFNQIKKLLVKYTPDPSLKNNILKAQSPTALLQVVQNKQTVPEFGLVAVQLFTTPNIPPIQFQIWQNTESDLAKQNARANLESIENRLSRIDEIKQRAIENITENYKLPTLK